MGDNTVRAWLVAGIACWSLGSTVMAQSVASDIQMNGVRKAATITLAVSNSPLENVLQEIAQQAGLNLFLKRDVVPANRRVTLDVRGVLADVAFEKALLGTGVRATVVAGSVVLRRASDVPATVIQGDVTGKIVDAQTKRPLRGAMVTLDDVTKGVVSDAEGAFRIVNVVPGSHVIRVRLLGYVKATKTVSVAEGQNVSMEIDLEPSVSALDQVIVTGTVAATSLKAVPNAMTVITAQDIERKGIVRIDQLFRGDIPGLFVLNQGSNSQIDSVTMFSRGATSLVDNTAAGISKSTNAIKTYVDGVELANPTYLSQIDPKSIERIEILTGPQASTIYGSNAINGVMQIFTKRGTTVRPQVTATFLSGFVENNFTSALTPQHDDAAQVSGTDGHWSYNAGGSWDYTGAWTPGKQTARWGGFGGARMQQGPVSVDGSLRLSVTQNRADGATSQIKTALSESGQIRLVGSTGRSAPETRTLHGQTLGLTLGYAPTSWWSHEVVLGSDASDSQRLVTGPGNLTPSDTLLVVTQTHYDRTSLRYAMTIHVPLSSIAQAVVTSGADQWQNMYTYLNATPATLTGTLSGVVAPVRKPDRNTGAFVQGQVGFSDALFVTYGLRAEWSPDYGAEANPNLAPRYGVAYTRDIGPITAKLRASYGRSTRPPSSDRKLGVPVTNAGLAAASLYVSLYGPFDYVLANPDLGPEHQQGGEGGVELYLGNRASVILTRYNQTVDGLIVGNSVDSVRSLTPNPSYSSSVLDDQGFGYFRQSQYLNVGSIRNQGWEVQSTLTTGPLTTRGTYSYTQSRFIGFTDQYRALANQFFTKGAPFSYLPEHTWAMSVSYGRAQTMVSLDLSGTGVLQNGGDNLYNTVSGANYGGLRLPVEQVRMNYPGGNVASIGRGYVMANVTASRRFTSAVEGLLQVQNLTNFYRNDYQVMYPTAGRQTQAGIRLRL